MMFFCSLGMKILNINIIDSTIHNFIIIIIINNNDTPNMKNEISNFIKIDYKKKKKKK